MDRAQATGPRSSPGIARWLADWAKREESWGHNLIALGEFNIDRGDDPNYQAFTSTGLRPPAELMGAPRTIFDGPAAAHFYDQIAWFTKWRRASALARLQWPRWLLRLHAGLPEHAVESGAVVAPIRPLPAMGRVQQQTRLGWLSAIGYRLSAIGYRLSADCSPSQSPADQAVVPAQRRGSRHLSVLASPVDRGDPGAIDPRQRACARVSERGAHLPIRLQRLRGVRFQSPL